MGQETLVRELIDEGSCLVNRLVDEGFGIEGAFWSYADEAEEWRLYIAMKADDGGVMPRYPKLYESIQKMNPTRLQPGDVVLTYPTDPMALAVESFQEGHPSHTGSRVRGQYLGKVYFDDAYIYPRVPHPANGAAVTPG